MFTPRHGLQITDVAARLRAILIAASNRNDSPVSTSSELRDKRRTLRGVSDKGEFMYPWCRLMIARRLRVSSSRDNAPLEGDRSDVLSVARFKTKTSLC